ncbi:MAG: hypothetical protein LBC62_01810 [Treponema sp.]|jgi:hypothetical protein|nr:hypothetical protein [Treponema sp.]
MPAVTVDITKKNGPIKPVNGIDNGPVCFGSLVDSSRYYKEAAFPYCRLHDTNYPHPREVDIPHIFRDFNADPDDPKNYDFRATDVYLNEILAVGSKIIYRLGVSIEHPGIKYFVDPPGDFDKWARICLNIARHYNEGWADGFRMGIDLWEVWNEPDGQHPDRKLDPMWSGTPEQYYELYAITSKLFKKKMPGVKIGGYAACGLLNEKLYSYFINFLEYITKENAPLDFYSWHCYTSNIGDLVRNAQLAREGLDKYGYKDAITICDEWNYTAGFIGIGGNKNIFDKWDGARNRYEFFTQCSNEAGAAFTAAAMIAMLDMPLDIATLYTGDPTNYYATIFDHFGRPTKQFRAYDAFNRLKQEGGRLFAVSEEEGIRAAAAGTEKGFGILIANYNSSSPVTELKLKGLDNDASWKYEVWTLDRWHDLEKTVERTLKTGELPKEIYPHRDTVEFIKLTKV